MNNYLLEIGVEEFPSRFIRSTKEQLEDRLSRGLEAEKVGFSDFRIESTPRRFSIFIDGLYAQDQEKLEIVRGPAKRIAFDEKGEPSKALQGFMRSKGLTLDQIYTEKAGKDEYVFGRLEKPPVSIEDVLKKVVPQSIRQVSNPRSMRWGGKDLLFLRPIRWLLSLYNDQLLSFDLEGIPLSNKTRGHRFLGSQEIRVDHIADYESLLEKNGVVLDEDKREDLIVRGMNRLAREQGGMPLMDRQLLDEVVHIVEYPTVFMGQIPQEYLKLPKEVVVTPMKDHQRYFPVVNEEGQLMPYFLSVRNGGDRGIENVVHGNETVLVARLEDAKFFYLNDLKHPLEDNVPKLAELTFHEKLGTMLDKTQRLVALSEQLGQELSIGADAMEHLKRAAFLSKADLVSQMVVEFTELQGTMGRIYAREAGENPLVAEAVEEQYMPRYSGADLPQSTAGMILSISDKIDSIAGLYAIGLEVTGSQDPFGLRRAAIGIIDNLLAYRVHLNLLKCFRAALAIYVDNQELVFDYDKVMPAIHDFFMGRLENKLREEGIRYDVVDAVLATEGHDIYSFKEKAKAVQALVEDEAGNGLVTSFIRVGSMASHAETAVFDPAVLKEEDQPMAASLKRAEPIQDEIKQGHYSQALSLLEEWMPTINQYMDKTMILVEEEGLRQARLAMLAQVDQLARQILIAEKIVREK